MSQYRLLENKPAELFEDAHLLGNGSLGASVFGGVPCEEILINHDTLWSGSENDKISPATLAHLQEARGLVLRGQLKEANNLINDHMLGYWSEAYMPLGRIYITINHTSDQRSMVQRRDLLNETPFTGYSRVLSLNDAVERIVYEQSGVRYVREMFVSHADNVLAIRLSAEGGALAFSLALDSPLRHEQRVEGYAVGVTGRAPDRVEAYQPHFNPPVVYRPDDVSDALRFACTARIVETDCEVSHDDYRLYASCGNYAVILVSAATNYTGYRVPRDRDTLRVLRTCESVVQNAMRNSYADLMRAHTADYSALYGRFDIELGEPVADALPTSQRLTLCQSIEDPSLPALVSQYVRYLLISFSRQGCQPGNLQGLWNPDVRPPWSSNYTTNINVQMNYWPAEAYALPECHLPLSDMVEELADSGKLAARKLYGANGWVAHHNTDLWRMTTLMGEDAAWAWWPFGGVWLCQHLWTHYAYSQDMHYLRDTVFPVLRGAVEFLLDYMVKTDDGYFVTAPSTSPENKFLLPGSALGDELSQVTAENRFSSNRRDVCAVCKASTMDLSLTRELFGNYLAAMQILGEEDPLAERVRGTLQALPPFRIGRWGQLQEWDEDYEECTPGMGHVSHLYGVYPSSVINAQDCPELFRAARVSLIRRMQHGGGHRHWPGSWSLCLNARFGDGVLCGQINSSLPAELGANLLVRGNWQIDCVMGWGAGIAEMLLQSHAGFLHLLPALPPTWVNGSVRGMRAQGGITVSMTWRLGELVRAEISAPINAECDLKYSSLFAKVSVAAGKTVALDGRLKPVSGKGDEHETNV